MYAYHYNICNEADENIFYKQCSAIEQCVPNLKKEKCLTDVDGGLIQVYIKDNKKIIVRNSEYIGAVFVESDEELEQYFK